MPVQWPTFRLPEKQRNIHHFLPHLFEPIAVENLGAFSSSTLNVLSDLGRRINDNCGDARETAYLFQRISVAIQRFNSVLLHDTLIVDSLDL